MKNLFFALLFFATANVFAQSVSVVATNGGSVTLSPEGVVRNTTTTGTRAAVSQTKAVKPKVQKVKANELISYKIDSLTLFEARQIRNSLTYVAYNENADANDEKAFDDVRKYIKANKKNEATTNVVSITVSKTVAERILNSLDLSGNSYMGSYSTKEDLKAEYNRLLKLLALKDKLTTQFKAAEATANIPTQNSIIRQ